MAPHDLLQRGPDELWSRYLIRSLEAAGKAVESLEDPGEFSVHCLVSRKRSLIIARECIDDPSEEAIRKVKDATTYSELGDVVDGDVSEYVLVDVLPQNRCEYLELKFLFQRDGMVTAEVMKNFQLEGIFREYQSGGPFKAENVIDDLVAYAKNPRRARGYFFGGSAQAVAKPSEQPPQKKGNGYRMGRMDLQDPHEGLSQLYWDKINEGLERSFTFKGDKIKYVLVKSGEIDGLPGRASGSLFFVAVDKAPEEWQQQIVAYHESLCASGHDAAQAAEIELAKALGKMEEYLVWQELVRRNVKPLPQEA